MGWDIERINYDHCEYVDYEMHRHSFHDVRLTWDREEDSWYAQLRVSVRSDGPCGDFGDPRYLSEAIVKGLRKIVVDVKSEDVA
jgi:hypothetical protein